MPGGLEGVGIHHHRVLHRRSRLPGQHVRHHRLDLDPVPSSDSHRSSPGLQGPVQHRSGAALSFRQVDVPTGPGQPVRLATRGTTHDIHRKPEVSHQPAHHLELLEVLLAEERPAGAHGTQQPGHHLGHTGEMPRTPHPIQRTGHVGHRDGRLDRNLRIDLFHSGVKEDRSPPRPTQFHVGIEVRRIGVQVLADTELERVDEHRHDGQIAARHRCVHQRPVALVQVPHGGNEPDRRSSGTR